MRNIALTCLLLFVLPMLSRLCADEPAPMSAKKPTAEAAKEAAAAWLAKLGDKGLVLELKRDEAGFKKQPVVGSPSVMYVFEGEGYWITFGFAGPLTPETKLEDVRKLLKYVALDRLPTPGLDLPGWEVRPQTPVSSFKEGVELTGYEKGRLQARVKTSLFALYGRDPAVLVPAGAATPRDAYFQIREPFALDLTVDLPVGK